MNLTHKATLTAIRAMGLSVRCVEGEYRITAKNVTPSRAEAMAYYTTDREDAIATARHFAEGGAR